MAGGCSVGREDAFLFVTRVIPFERDKRREHDGAAETGERFGPVDDFQNRHAGQQPRNFTGEKNDLINRRGKRAIAMRKIDNRPCKIERIAADLAKRKRHDKLVTARYTRHAAFAVRLSYRWLKWYVATGGIL